MHRPNRDELINRVQCLAYQGRLSRRDFIRILVALGVAGTHAATIAARAQEAQNVQFKNLRQLRTNYDFVIVGGGSAGSLLANRLSANKDCSVLLLEAGVDDLTLPEIRNASRAWDNLGSERVWEVTTIPQAAAGGRELLLPSGKTLGGSGSVNAMIWLLGDPRDYESWERFGGGIWSYSACRELFLSLETYLESSATGRGKDGDFPITQASRDHALTDAWLAAANEVGFPLVELNGGGSLDGTGVLDYNILDGRRMGPGQVLLQPAMTRRNLTVVEGALARRLIISNDEVVGVEVTISGDQWKFAADEEVILAAGALKTPKLLQCSGVGPENVLRAAGIAVKHRLEGVGRNLQDHFLAKLTIQSKTRLPPHTGTGYATEAFGRTNSEEEAPNLHFLTAQHSDGEPGIQADQAFSIYFGLGKPTSRGKVEVRSPDIQRPASVDPRYLSTTTDLRAAALAFEMAEAMIHTQALRNEGTGTLHLREGSVLEFIQQNIGTYFHYAGTCRMGGDDSAVVDPSLRVRGVRRLRIADASVIPEIPCVNTHVPTLVVAERAARWIAAQR